MIQNIILFFKNNLRDSAEINQHNLVPAVIIGILAHIIFYFYHLNFLGLKESIIIRSLAILAFAISAIYYCYLQFHKNFKLQIFFPIFWHITLIIALPLSITYNLLLNDFHYIWLWWMIFMPICLSIFVPNWITYTIDLTIGLVFAYICYILSGDNIIKLDQNFDYISYGLVFAFSAIGGILFSHKNKKAWLEDPKKQNEILKLMAGSIAHELKIPLEAIKLNSDNLNHKEDVDLFKRNTNKIISLATNIIDVNLLEISGQKIDKNDFKYIGAQNVIIDALSIYGYEHHHDKNIININFDEDNLVTANDIENINRTELYNFKSNNNFPILALDAPLKYIIFNLIRNSIFYTKNHNNPTINISFEKNKEITKDIIKKFKLDKKITRYNVINFTDNSSIFYKKILFNIFDINFNCNKKDNTGLELEFCKRTIQKFGGDIICEVKSKYNTKFSLLLPILSGEKNNKAIKKITDFEKERQKELKTKQYISQIEKSLKQKNSKNILLVDDVRLTIEILAKELHDKCSNLDITIVTDPIKAINLIKNRHNEPNHFDLVLTDIEMPVMNGIELVKEIRNGLKISKDELPILAYSAKEGQRIIDKAINSGCNAYYSKPKELRFIARNISKWVLNDYIPNRNINHKEIIINSTILENINVIIADDQAVNLTLITKKLFDAGAEVQKCTDGQEIVDLVEKDPTKYELIITDIHMEHVNGDIAAKQVREIERIYNKTHNSNHKVPIIALSGDIQRDSVIQMLNNGVDDYIAKSKDPKDLIKLSKFWVDYRIDQNKLHPVQDQQILQNDFFSVFSDKNEAMEIINIFEAEGNKAINDIREHKSDTAKLKQLIHKLKGAAGSIGTVKLYNYLIELYDIIKIDKLPEDQNFDDIIEQEIHNSLDEMRKIIDKAF
ncbi:response regulator [Rickettsiales bacterium]|nr:response regulator [Rickettsiales bacterium]